ncbi:SDR family NAD(P)-dependent oxidoreductase [Parapusillimonas sp. JC17]|uniref:SDR family NAD(P)-dependent oxidoreductase n=1 Tax=Parapusillimonas sp. JC17 TaxID=3445768 RepID=UPI003FA12F5A
MNRFNQWVAIVTAASHGIGTDYARTMAAAGACVAITDTDETGLAQQIEAEGGSAIAIAVDTSIESEATKMAWTVMEHFGRIDVLINNTAGDTMSAGQFGESPLNWDRHVAQDLQRIFACAKATIPFMRRSQYGCIVNICPRITPNSGVLLHQVARSNAIETLSGSLADELEREGIQVETLTSPAELLKLAAGWSRHFSTEAGLSQ